MWEYLSIIAVTVGGLYVILRIFDHMMKKDMEGYFPPSKEMIMMNDKNNCFLKSGIEELFGQYWDIAYDEGASGVSDSTKANEILHQLRVAISAAFNQKWYNYGKEMAPEQNKLSLAKQIEAIKAEIVAQSAAERIGVLAQKARASAMSLRFDRDCPKCSAVFADCETKAAADLLDELAASLVATPPAQSVSAEIDRALAAPVIEYCGKSEPQGGHMVCCGEPVAQSEQAQEPKPQYSWSEDGKKVSFKNYDECIAYEKGKARTDGGFALSTLAELTDAIDRANARLIAYPEPVAELTDEQIYEYARVFDDSLCMLEEGDPCLAGNERLAFERWASSFGWSVDRTDDGDYRTMSIDAAWGAWQARALLAASPQPAPQEQP